MKTFLAVSLTAGFVIWIHRRRYHRIANAVGAYYAAEVLR